MGFFDSFKTGISGVADFLTDITGAALGAAPTIIPLLQSTGVIPTVRQPPIIMTGQRGPTALPGGAMVPFGTGPRVNPFAANIPLAQAPSFPTGRPSRFPFAPGGTMPAFQSTRGGFRPAEFTLPNGNGFDLPFVDIVPQGAGPASARLLAPFVPTMAGARAQAHIQANPVTGALTWFKPAGKPILWSGDLTACKRVGRIAARARRAKR